MTVAMLEFRLPHLGRERLAPRVNVPRHRHRQGYIAVVLSGGYEEAGLAGRFDLGAGCVAVHRTFDAHLDKVQHIGAELLNLPLPCGTNLPNFFRIEDPDSIARLAERDVRSAVLALRPRSLVAAGNDWQDELAADIIETPELQLRPWANANGLAAETLSRGFRKAFGVTPVRFRIEMQARRALQLIEGTDAPLAGIAAECGFSDQPHLNRIIVQLTGRSPGSWRRESIPFKTSRTHRR